MPSIHTLRNVFLRAGTAGKFHARQINHLRAELEEGYWAVQPGEMAVKEKARMF